MKLNTFHLHVALVFASMVLMAGLLYYKTEHSANNGVQQEDKDTLTRIPIAILGDSDSHSYQDRIHFPLGTPARGGPYRATSLQWTDILARLRGDQIDLGEWGQQGTSPRIAKLLKHAGLEQRFPKKEDYAHNFSISGALCEDLNDGRWEESNQLLHFMRQQPDRWTNGIVIIRIGINSFGLKSDLDLLSRNADDPTVQRKILNCTDAISKAVRLLLRENPSLRFVLVGIFNNAHWAKYLRHWHDPVKLHNIDRALNHFDNQLKKMAADNRNILFFDDRLLFRTVWGSRDEHGLPAYRSISLQNLTIENTAGDSPDNLTLEDGHTGTAWNGLWTKHLIMLLNKGFELKIRPIDDKELASLMRQ